MQVTFGPPFPACPLAFGLVSHFEKLVYLFINQ